MLGWIGMIDAVRNALSVVGADREPDGAFRISGSVVSGFDGAEVVIGADATYFCGGEPKNLAGLMRGTSQGIGVVVF